MKDIAKWFTDQNNVTFFIAIVSFLLSVGSAVKASVNSRESYKIEVIDYAYRNSQAIQFLISIANCSDSPLSITDISVFGTTCELVPKKIYGSPDTWNFRHTPDFPLCISSHGCQYAYLEFIGENFQIDSLAPGKKVVFEIRSTKKTQQKIVVLANESHYLHFRK